MIVQAPQNHAVNMAHQETGICEITIFLKPSAAQKLDRTHQKHCRSLNFSDNLFLHFDLALAGFFSHHHLQVSVHRSYFSRKWVTL
jgi:hypothetical protein